jgi:cytoskeletal protein CcmA (bactofilin family)
MAMIVIRRHRRRRRALPRKRASQGAHLMFKKPNAAPPAMSFRAEAETRPAKGVSVLGPTLTFRGGELSSDEDLIIEGVVEGKIAHQSHHLTIGKQGRVKANIKARLITVLGTVEGDLHGDEGVQIAASAHVVGNVVSPRVSLESGARFDGGIITTKEEPRVASPEMVSMLASGDAVTR